MHNENTERNIQLADALKARGLKSQSTGSLVLITSQQEGTGHAAATDIGEQTG
jgi:hypothetical protein